MAFVSSFTFLMLFSIVSLLIIKHFQSKKDVRPLPPGPKGTPLLGNVNDMPKPDAMPWLHWLEHKELYGAYGISDTRLVQLLKARHIQVRSARSPF